MRSFRRMACAAFVAVIAASAAPGHAQTPVKLRFSSFEPPAANLTSNVFVPWARDVTGASSGTLDVEVFAGGALGRNPAQQLKLVLDGVADIAWIVGGYTPGRFDDIDVTALPFVIRNSTEASVALTRLHARGVIGGFDELRLIGLISTPPLMIHSRTPVRTIADLKGKRVRATGDHLLKVIEALGGAPVQLAGPAIAEGLSKGVVDMTFNNWGFVGDFKVNEVTSHHLTMPMGAVAVMVAMLKSRYEALPAAGKAAIDRFSGEPFARRMGQAFDRQDGEVADRIAKSGKNTVLAPSAADVEAFRKVVEPVNEGWRKARPRNESIYQAFVDELGKVRAGQ